MSSEKHAAKPSAADGQPTEPRDERAPAVVARSEKPGKKEEKKRGAVAAAPGGDGAAATAAPAWLPGPLADLWAGVDGLFAGAASGAGIPWKATLVKGILLGAALAGLTHLVLRLEPFATGKTGKAKPSLFDRRRGPEGRAAVANEGLIARIPGIYERIFGPKKEPEPAAPRPSPEDDGSSALVSPAPLGGAAPGGRRTGPGARLERAAGFGERSEGQGGGGFAPARPGALGREERGDASLAAAAGRGSGGAGERGASGGRKGRRSDARAGPGRKGMVSGPAREQLVVAQNLAGEGRFGSNEAAGGALSAAFDGRAIGGPGAGVGVRDGGVGSMGKAEGVGGGGMGAGALEPEGSGGGEPVKGGPGGDGLEDPKDVTPWQKELARAKSLLTDGDRLKRDGRMYILAGFAALAVAWKAPTPINGILLTAALGLIGRGYSQYREGNQKLEEVRQIADGLVERYGQKDQAKILRNGTVSAGSGLPLKDPASCGYTPDLDSAELRAFLRCMSASPAAADG